MAAERGEMGGAAHDHEPPPRPVLRVFISSTYLDNRDRRQRVDTAVRQAHMLPVGMERFAAQAQSVVEVSVRQAAECDLYVLILAHRYGGIPPGHSVSVTELEYDAAALAGRPQLVFLLSDDVPIIPDQAYDEREQRWEKQKLLAAFKAKCGAGRTTPRRFIEAELQADVLHALHDWLAEHDPRPRREATLPPVSSALAHYAQAAQAVHGVIAIAGFASRLRAELDLEGLYVPLRALVDLRGAGDATFADASDAEQRLAGHTQEIGLFEAFREAAHRQRRALVILGDPGAGKTTLLKRLLLYCLRRDPNELGLPPHTLPVFLPLRELGALRGDLAGFIDQQLAQLDGELAGMGKPLLAARRPLLLLFDGLDEVADAHERDAVAKWVEELARTKSDCTIVVSCRFAGYSDGARFGPKFLELHVRPLSSEDADAFVRNWFRLVETQLAPGDLTARRALADKNADELGVRLRESGQRSARVVEMVRNPLLLANVCLLYRDRGELPRGRARLYGECIDVLLEHWRESKRLNVDVTAEAGRRVLQPVALWLHQRERRRASSAELEPVLEPALRAVQYRGSAREFLRSVRDETGLLTGWASDEFGFMHLGFQEYLAARELRRLAFEEGDAAAPQLVAQHYGQSWWQEVIVVLFSLGEPSPFRLFMQQLVLSPAFAQERGLLELLFEDAAEVSPEPFEALLRRSTEREAPLWPMQLMAAQVLSQRFPQLAHWQAALATHPSPALRQWLSQHKAVLKQAEHQEVRFAKAADVVLVFIEGGTFLMGSPESDEESHADERPQHTVTVSSFYLGRYPVTNEQYARFLKANPDAREPTYWADRSYNQARQPVVGVSWEDATQFAQWAGCRLPTEAEWEYACRAGTQESRYGELDEIAWYAWYAENSEHQLQPAGMKQPNAWGLHDMLGNVWEWCADCYGPYDSAAVTDPSGFGFAAVRVIRGGAWGNDPRYVRAAYRSRLAPADRYDSLGFRLARGQSGSSQ